MLDSWRLVAGGYLVVLVGSFIDGGLEIEIEKFFFTVGLFV